MRDFSLKAWNPNLTLTQFLILNKLVHCEIFLLDFLNIYDQVYYNTYLLTLTLNT